MPLLPTRRSRVLPVLTAVLLLVLGLLLAAPAVARAQTTQTTESQTIQALTAESASGLPSTTSGVRPGPDALHLPPPRAPQLENTGVWTAEPILISGVQAYRDGEWLYQDFLFDDHGATGVVDRNEPYGTSTNLYSPRGGTFTYPQDERYRNNAGDIVELRVRALSDATAVRVTMNTMTDPELVGLTVALGDGGPHAWPAGANVSGPADVFLTAVGETAVLRDAASGEELEGATSEVDLERRQIDLRIPHDAYDPGTGQVPITAGVGLWDADADAYLVAQPGFADADTPGGGTQGVGSALINVVPRLDEPTPTLVGATMADTAAGARATAPWWRERQQSLQLTRRDVGPFATPIDFAVLAAGGTDESTIPTSGAMDRIHASRHVFGQGVDPTKVCFALTIPVTEPGTACEGRYVGQLQPYAIYVPEGAPPAGGWGITLLMHSLSANHNQYLGSENQRQLGERGEGHVVITPEARGPDGFTTGVPEAATFEAWADAARHHPINPAKAAASGYSMGGFSTYRLLARYPDLFASGFSVVAAPGTVEDQLASLLDVPFLSWNADADELVNIQTSEAAHAALVEAGIAHQHDLFTTADHLTLAGNDEYQPGADFMGDRTALADPPTVRYVLDPSEDSAEVVADSAWWVSGIELADDAAGPGTIEVHSGGFGVSPPGPVSSTPGGGVLVGGQNQAMNYVSRIVTRAEREAAPVADRLDITATNVRAVTVDAPRARVSCDAEVVVAGEQPVDVTFTGCGPAEVSRVEGADRVATAVAVSRTVFADGAAGAAVLARADVAADALAGGPLAVAVDGPLLLSGVADVPEDTVEELRRVLPAGGVVHLLGGPAALDDTVAAQLAAEGFEVRRHGGADRFATSALIAAEVLDLQGGEDDEAAGTEVVLADGATFADAVVAGPLAARRGSPLLLTDGERLPDEVAELVGERPVVAVGPAAVAAAPRASLRLDGSLTGSVDTDVASTVFGDATTIGLARQDVFADALTSAVLLGRAYGGPVLLVSPEGPSGTVLGHLRGNAGRLQQVLLFGGPAAVSPASEAAISQAVTPAA